MVSWVYSLNPFPNSSSMTAVLNFLCFVLYLHHQLNFTYTFLYNYYGINTFLTEYIISNLVPAQLSIMAYVAVPLVIVISIISALYNEDKYYGIRFLFGWVGIRVFPILRILLEANTALAAYFMIIDNYSIVLFILAAIVNLLGTFFLQNYIISKDNLKCGNVQFSLVLRIIMYFNIILNQCGIWYQSEAFYNALLSVRLLCSIILWVAYITKGITIYRHPIPKYLMMLLIIAYLCLTFGQFIDQMVFVLYLHDNYFDYVYIMMMILPTFFLTYIIYLYKRQTSLSATNEDLISKAFFLKDRLMTFSDDIQSQCCIRGLVLSHAKEECPNPHCYSHKLVNYDSKKNKYIDINKIAVSKSAFSSMLMKCCYDRRDDQKNVSLMINKAQFIFLKFKNTYKSLHLIEECDAKFQFPFDRLRTVRLKNIIKQENKRLNKQLYNSSLDIEFIIESQKVFQNLKTLIFSVIKKNMIFWSTVHHNKVDLTELINTVEPNFKVMQTINDQWKKLAKYFEIQKKWKFYYAWYNLYVRNQKLKPVVLEYFTTQVKQQDIFNDLKTYNDKQDRIQSKIIFQETSAAIHTNSNALNPNIKRVNSYFTKLFGYQQSQILESPLEILMTKTVSEEHHNILFNWADSGKSTNESNYQIMKHFVKHKQGYLVSANKYLKQLVTSQNELQYVALIQNSNEHQNVLLVDQEMNIEGMTQSVYQILDLKSIGLEYLDTLNLNFLLILPKLIKNSNFRSLTTESDDLLFQLISDKINNLNRKETMRRSSFHIPSKQILEGPYDENSQLRVRCELRIPIKIKEIVDSLSKQKSEVKTPNQKLGIIRKAMMMRQQSQFMRFTCELNVVSKVINNKKYFQIYVFGINNLQKKNIINSSVERRKQKINATDFETTNFHRFFQAGDDNKVFSLEYSNNIFIKEDNNKPVTQLHHIDGLKNMLRVFFMGIILTCLVSFLHISYRGFSEYSQYSKKMVAMQNLDLYMFYLQSNLYDIHFYNNDMVSPAYNNTIFFNNSIARFTKTYYKLSYQKQNNYFKQSIFNQSINPEDDYESSNIFTFFGVDIRTLVLDQVDLPFKLFQTTEALFSLPPTILSFNSALQKLLQSYLTPSFESLITVAEYNLYKSMQVTTKQIMNISIIVYVVEGILVMIAFAMAIYKITKIIESFISMVEVFTQFSQQDIQKVYKYCHFLAKLFKYLNKKDKKQKSITIKDEEDPDASKLGPSSTLQFNLNYYQAESNNININKKIKKIQIGSGLNKLRVMTFVLIILSLLLFVGGCFYCNSLMRVQNSSIETLYKAGNQHFTYYTTITKILSAVQKKFSNATLYQQVFAASYASQIQQMLNFKSQNSRMTQTPQNFTFISKYNQIYFQNVCKYMILGNATDLKRCQSVSESSLQYGIQSFVYFFTDTALAYLNGNQDLTFDQIQKFEQGLDYVNVFMFDLQLFWIDQMKETIQKYQNNLLISTICIFAGLILIYLVIFQLLVIRSLNNQYKTLRTIYDMYMPDFLVTKEKIIKAKLVVDGILHK